jgi:post-segregation antitoxin (ccd killing protein)
MTTVQVTIADDLANEARRAGLLTPEALTEMLRARLREQAGSTLREMWRKSAQDEITEEQLSRK